jgi:putative oxidoreductase
MTATLTRWALALLRIVSGLLFICPGALKILGWFGGMPAGFALTPLLRAAGWIELVGGTLILIGLFTRPAAFICSGEMCFAYFIGHFPKGFWPVQNHGEPAVLFCFIFLFLSAAGAGPLSLDGLIAARRARGLTQASPARTPPRGPGEASAPERSA